MKIVYGKANRALYIQCGSVSFPLINGELRTRESSHDCVSVECANGEFVQVSIAQLNALLQGAR